MSKRLILASLALCTVLLPRLALAAYAADDRDFSFVNNSSAPIDVANVAPSDAALWGGNVLSSEINPGEIRDIYFTDPQETCTYDLHVTFDDGRTAELHGLDLCNTNIVTLDDRFMTAR